MINHEGWRRNDTLSTLTIKLVPTWAFQTSCQLRGHHLDYQTDAEPEHLHKQAGLWPDVHGQVHNDLL